jgi:flotillin
MFDGIDLTIVISVIGIIVALALIIFAIAKRYRIPDANEALIVLGTPNKGTGPNALAEAKVVIGGSGGAFIIPFVQRFATIDLGTYKLTLQVREGVSKDNIKVIVEAVAMAKVDGTPAAVRAAAQRFLYREEDIPGIVTDILAGALRGVVGNMTVDEMLRDREGLASKIREAATQALSDAGLIVDTLQINGISTDPPEYITNLGRPQAAEAKRLAEVSEADNQRQSEEAQARAAIAIAEARKEAALKTAEFKKETEKADAEAAAVGPKIEAEQQAIITQAEQANAEQQAKLTKLQLDSEVRAKADAALYEAQKLADAKLYTAEQEAKARAVQVTAAAEAENTRLTQEGEGKASATRAAGLAEAEAEKAKMVAEGEGRAQAIKAAGLAEAEAIRAKGVAEAATKELLAAAYEQYGQQAIIDRVLGVLPELMAAAAKPIGDIDSITVLGNADSASGITKLSTDLLVQVPAVVKSATGLDISELLRDWLSQNLPEVTEVASGHDTTA